MRSVAVVEEEKGGRMQGPRCAGLAGAQLVGRRAAASGAPHLKGILRQPRDPWYGPTTSMPSPAAGPALPAAAAAAGASLAAAPAAPAASPPSAGGGRLQ